MKQVLCLTIATVVIFSSCSKESLRTSSTTGFFSFKEHWEQSNGTTIRAHDWIFDSVEVVPTLTDTYRLRFIFDGIEPDTPKLFQNITGSQSYFSQFSPNFVFDRATDTCTNIYNSVAFPSNGRAAIKNPTITSRFDSQTQTYYLHYILRQPGFYDMYISDTLKKLP